MPLNGICAYLMFSCVSVRWYHDCWSYAQPFRQKLASVYYVLPILCDLLQVSTKGIKSSSYNMCVMDIHNSGSLILILPFLWLIDDMLQSYSPFKKSNKLPVKGLILIFSFFNIHVWSVQILPLYLVIFMIN